MEVRMKTTFRYLLLAVLLLAFISAPTTRLVQPALAAPANCADSSPLSALYVVEVCITSPASGDTFITNGTITATASVLSGTNPGVQRMIFYLDSTYLLTSYASPYSFTLPTNRYVDGSYTLYAQALMRDGFTTTQASITLILNTGTITPPVNTNTFTPTSGRPAGGQPFVLAAVGDGASGETGAANVTTLIKNNNPNLFLYLGDVYEQGSIAEFFNWYGNSGSFFDQFHSITDPTVGHHEYLVDGNASPYFYYWDNVPNYYSFDANGWHIISLNSHGAAGGTNSAEYQWLQTDLAAHPATCTIAYYHNPLYSIGVEPPDLAMNSIWQLLAQNYADIVLSGNDHDYERWVPMDGNGVPNSNGITEFVIGTGGHSLQTITGSDSRVAFSDSADSGVLFLTLNSNNASFSFVNPNQVVLDSGTIPCNPVATFSNTIYFPLIEK
jgi:hypothetical protein